jgi:hypothetical protein
MEYIGTSLNVSLSILCQHAITNCFDLTVYYLLILANILTVYLELFSGYS